MSDRLPIHDRIRRRVARHVAGQLEIIIGLLESIQDHFGYRFCNRCLTLMERSTSDLDEISECLKGEKHAHSEQEILVGIVVGGRVYAGVWSVGGDG